ncbi:MAG: molybdenum cofactor guanylyltransferase [Fretibacterium sp.]|nr:molybdenum cofactor guanylyltransferase [Fretibacterium sp.]
MNNNRFDFFDIAAAVTAAVLAGGASSRIGEDKALLKLEGRSLLQWVVDKVAPFADELLVVGRSGGAEAARGLRFVPDVDGDERSSLRGLHSALTHASGNFVLVLSCDTPLLDPRLFPLLLSLRDEADIVLPQVEGRWEPFCALYRRTVSAATGRLLAAGQKRVLTLLEEPLRVRAVRPEDCPFPLDPRSFLNVNTMDDYRRAQELLASRQEGSGTPTSGDDVRKGAQAE